MRSGVVGETFRWLQIEWSQLRGYVMAYFPAELRLGLLKRCVGLKALLADQNNVFYYLQDVDSIEMKARTAPDDSLAAVADELIELIRCLMAIPALDGEGIINISRWKTYLG
jgi:hypothetical protein